jgi:cytochrome c
MRIFVLIAGAGLLSTVSASAQDAAAGEKVFVQCKACHQIGENAKNAVGPVLNGLFGRKAGSIEGYNYSSANKNSGITWDEATFREYIKDPRAKIPGTKMAFPGLKDPKQIDDVVAYLKQFDSTGKKAGMAPAGGK